MATDVHGATAIAAAEDDLEAVSSVRAVSRVTSRDSMAANGSLGGR